MNSQSRRDTKAAFESMFEHASIGIIIANSEGRIEKVNAHANELFGYESGELIGQKIEALIPAPLRGRHVEHREQYNQHPVPRSMGLGMNLSALKKDGTTFPVEISLASYETKNGKEVVSFINDITRRKMADEALRKLNEELESKVEKRTEALSQAIKELEQVNENLNHEMEHRKKAEEEARVAFEKEKDLGELKSRFVSMASHEFRTPLSGILTSVSLIDRYNQEGNQEKIGKHVQTIKASVKNLTNILTDFLSLDKLETGRIECRPSEFILSHFAKDLAHEMESIAKKDQKIRHEHRVDRADPNDRGMVFLDREILRNILINLLSNAIKYSPEAAQIHFVTMIREGSVSLTVKDAGIGIPKAEQRHLFERFFRAQNVTAVQGTGLGLNIVKRYLDLMGGTIHFSSEENSGTTFTVAIPQK